MKKLWGIRHIRWILARTRFAFWWIFVGSKYWMVPNQYDLDYMDDILKGNS